MYPYPISSKGMDRWLLPLLYRQLRAMLQYIQCVPSPQWLILKTFPCVNNVVPLYFYDRRDAFFLNLLFSCQANPVWGIDLAQVYDVQSVVIINRDIGRKFQNHHCAMMTSSNGNIFRATGPLWGELIGHRWIPLTKASDAQLWSFIWSAPE